MRHARHARLALVLTVAAGASACASAGSASGSQTPKMGFFITSAGRGDGANLGGLAGADAHCASLAESAGVTGRTWHAYLGQPARERAPAVNARDRIGRGPWTNYNGVVVATSVDDLHSASNALTKANASRSAARR